MIFNKLAHNALKSTDIISRLSALDIIEKQELYISSYSIKPCVEYYRADDVEKAIYTLPPVKECRLVSTAHWHYNKKYSYWECSLCMCRNRNIPGISGISPQDYEGTKFCSECGSVMKY